MQRRFERVAAVVARPCQHEHMRRMMRRVDQHFSRSIGSGAAGTLHQIGASSQRALLNGADGVGT